MRSPTILLLLLSLSAPPTPADTREERIAALLAGLEEVGRLELAWREVPEDQRKALPSPYKASFPILKAPPDILAEAIDRGIRQGSMTVKLGALYVYGIALGTPERLPKNPEYRKVLIDFLRQDDQHSVIYTEALIASLRMYPSVETIEAYLDTLPRTRDPVIREGLLQCSASVLQLFVPLYVTTTALEKERILADLESWLNRNRDRIRFKKDGRPYLAGGEAGEKGPDLRPEDRARIRKDPACVLQLLHAMMEGSDSGAALVERCGAALLGAEGVRALQDSLAKEEGEGGPSFDRQMAMTAMHGKYPTMDAVQLAVAYVAAYQTDPAHRRLAMEVYDELGTPEIDRVLKGEPREVRKKAMELVEEVSGED